MMPTRFWLVSFALIAVTASHLASGAGPAIAARDAAATVEANRPRIVERVVGAHGAAMVEHGVSLDVFRAALWELPAAALLAASLADSPEEVNTIMAQAFATEPPVDVKDGQGTGPNSWIGYVGGGNVASGSGSAVAAGTSNVASGVNSFVAAGTFNAANGQGSFVGGGTSNVANATSALVMGGFDNQATVIDSAVVAGAGNRATGARSVVVGGGYNVASGQWSFIGGGGRQSGSGAAGTSVQDNVAGGDFSTIGGGSGNLAGGAYKHDSRVYDTIAGGQNNTAAAFHDTVGGGLGNTAQGGYSTVGGGSGNVASLIGATVPGGVSNTASGQYSFAAGTQSTASGANSFALGTRAKASTDGSFIWADNNAFDFGPSVNNFFGVRATGGVGLTVAINPTTGAVTQFCNLLPGTPSWQCTSDRAAKENLVAVDGRDVLNRLGALPLYFWNFKGADPANRALGPMAQDFYAAFQLGDNDKAIAGANVEGVALAAIQGLKQEIEARDAQIEQLRTRLEAVEREIAHGRP